MNCCSHFGNTIFPNSFVRLKQEFTGLKVNVTSFVSAGFQSESNKRLFNKDVLPFNGNEDLSFDSL